MLSTWIEKHMGVSKSVLHVDEATNYVTHELEIGTIENQGVRYVGRRAWSGSFS